MTIYLVRHAQTEANKNRIIQGQKDTPLTEEGLKETFRTAKYLCDKNITRVFSSPLGRTAQTSQIIANEVGFSKNSIVFVDGLKEIDLRPWLMADISTLDDSDALSSYKTYKGSPLLFKAESGENFIDVQKRTIEAMKQIVDQCADDDNIVVVSHSVAIRTFLLYADEMGFEHIWRYKIRPSSVTKMFYKDSKFATVEIGYCPFESFDN